MNNNKQNEVSEMGKRTMQDMLKMLQLDLEFIEHDINYMQQRLVEREIKRKKIINAIEDIERMLNDGEIS
ncbi:hypothetical protein ABE073_04945 [Lederbergia citrisecunda]|uniref:hypothetical protein n=1 Tax=Lederbergia citrisecunda TaxID=2833583 RepID=UPI003D27B64F